MESPGWDAQGDTVYGRNCKETRGDPHGDPEAPTAGTVRSPLFSVTAWDHLGGADWEVCGAAGSPREPGGTLQGT